MIINNILFNVELRDILSELITEMRINNIEYMQKTKETQTHIQVCCPYHNNGMERRPSAGIRKSDGKFHCFACNEVHDLPEVISYCLGHTDDIFGKYGMKWLLKNFANIRMEERKGVKLDFVRNKGNVRIDSINDTNRSSSNTNIHSSADNNKYVPEEELDSYRYYHPYWTERGITDNDIIELFDLGYSKKDNCITFPVRDINGNCLFVAKRNIKTKWFNYPEGVEKPLYGLYELHRQTDLWTRPVDVNGSVITKPSNIPTEIIICESMIDCILLWQAGFYAIALNGTGTEEQFTQLRQLPVRHLILATDNDSAGQNARERIFKNVNNKLFTEIIFPSNIKDIGDLGKARRFEDIQNIKNWEVFI